MSPASFHRSPKVAGKLSRIEPRTRALGYPTQRYKLASFVVAGMLAGLAGYLACAQFGFVNPALTAQPRTLSGYQTALLGSPGDFLQNLGQYFSGSAAGAAGATFFLPADNLVTPFSQHWALTIEQQWRTDYLL